MVVVDKAYWSQDLVRVQIHQAEGNLDRRNRIGGTVSDKVRQAKMNEVQ